MNLIISVLRKGFFVIDKSIFKKVHLKIENFMKSWPWHSPDEASLVIY